MTPLGDPLTLVGGGGIFAGIVVLFTLLVKRLTAQDSGWKSIVAQQAEDLKLLRAELVAARLEMAALRLQIAELQRWGERHDR